ncbi:MAG: hypothetical protein U9N85_00965, partial [Bacteroidota bacterium]|nr:hypothetical protein [Bacteroidota bacterium]
MKTRLLIFLLAIFSLYSTQNIQAQLSGDYTIGSGDFPHFSAAIDSLNTYGISGDVNFAVQDDTYNEQIIFPEALVYGPHSIYFYAASGQIGQVIMGLAPPSIDNYILKFESGSNITFENIIFQNTNVASDVAGGVILFDNTIFPIVNVNFINCNFIGVPVAEPHDVAENNIVTRDNSAMEPPSNGLLFQNCQFFNGNSALSLRGYESEPDSLTSIEDCYFNNFYADAIHLEFTMNSNISGNEINGKPSAVAFQQGIYAKNCDSLKVNSNKITLNGVNNTGIMSELGYLSTTIANNMVICNAGNINYGIAHNESENIKVYYNSVSINAGMGAAFSDMLMSPLGSDIRNN